MASTTFNYSDSSSQTVLLTSINGTSYNTAKTLTSVVVGTAVLDISANTFGGSTGLNSVTFNSPSSVTTFGAQVFQFCTVLNSITLPNSLLTLGDSCFATCSALSSITLPNSLQALPNNCFSRCSALSSITIPDAVTSLGNSCFTGCNSLTSITIPENVVTLGNSCFDFSGNIPTLNSVIFGSSVRDISNNCFRACTSLRTLQFNNQNNLTGIVGTGIFTDVTTAFDSVTYYSTASVADLTSDSIALQTQMPAGTSNFIYLSQAACFNEGTKILCLNKNFEEEYISIENLKKGDLVKSYKHGYRKIEFIGKGCIINNPDKFNECMYKMEKTEENGLLEDLIITGGHSILVDDLGIFKEENVRLQGSEQQIDDKKLLLSALSTDFIQLENRDSYTYYHFILENNGTDDNERFGVWANGILTETPSKHYFVNHILPNIILN